MEHCKVYEKNAVEVGEIIIDNINFIPRCDLLNEAMTNIGYKISETIMEGIDNSLDNGATNIQIHIWQEQFQEFKNSVVKGNIANRYGYIICDDGDGIENIENVFEPRVCEGVIYSDKKKYMTMNGKFNFGDYSHINVADEVSIYSRDINRDEWIGRTLKFERINNCPYISDVIHMNENIKGIMTSAGLEIPKEKGTILVVRGIHKNVVFKDVDEFKLKLLNELGVAYHDYLVKQCSDTTEKLISIKVGNCLVHPLNPLCEISEDILIKPEIFGQYKITMDECAFPFKIDT